MTGIRKFKNGRTNSDESIGGHISGSVEYSVEVPDEKLGNVILEGKFVRIKPKCERILPKDELVILENNLTKWATKYFNVEKDENSFRDVIASSVIMSTCIDPWAKVYSREMDLGIKSLFWYWIMDDILEDAVAEKMSIEDIRKGTNFLYKVMFFEENGLKIEELNQVFRPLVTCYLALRQELHDFIPDYKQKSTCLIPIMKRFFEIIHMYALLPNEKKFGQSTELFLRNVSIFGDGIIISVCLIHNLTFSEKVLGSTSYYRLVELDHEYSSYTNDILGILKDLNTKFPNLVIAKRDDEGISLKEAAKEINMRITDIVKDFCIIKDIMRAEYSNEKNIEVLLDRYDSHFDGQLILYDKCPRYGVQKAVNFTR